MKTQNSPIEKLQAKEQEILKKWKNKYSHVDEDGVVDWIEYLKQAKKILFLLKETDGLYSSLTDFLQKGAIDAKSTKIWNTVVRWTFGIENLDNNPIEKYEQVDSIDNKKRKEFLSKIAVVNLKKTPGGSTANPKEIKKYVNENYNLLREQIDLYKPDIIICGGTKNWIQQIFPEIKSFQSTKNGVNYIYFNHKLFVCCYHPSAYVNKKNTYEKLISALQEINKQTP